MPTWKPRRRAASTSPRCSVLPVEPGTPDRHRDGGLARLDDGQADVALQAVAVAGHAGAAHHDDIGAVFVAQFDGDLGHAAEGARLVAEFGDAETDGAVAGHAVVNAHLPDIAQMARN